MPTTTVYVITVKFPDEYRSIAMKKQNSFNLRSFTSFSLVISTIVMSWSGFILYFAPPGRIANWTGWKIMLFTKAEWQAFHTIFSFMFFILFIIHLFFVNWKAFLTYFRSRIRKGLNRKRELFAAVGISLLFFTGTLASWAPFGTVMDFGETLKEGWDKKYESPAIAHMEEFTLLRLATVFAGVSSDDLLITLRDSGIVVRGQNARLKHIAADNGVTPARLYEILTRRYPGDEESHKYEVPSGIGKMTINMVASRLGKDPSVLTGILRDMGVSANGESTLRTVAVQLGISPHDLYSLLTGDRN
ncbi:MAG TPA: DUF4405 domain-containing protein [Bacteroidales bacterium]|jgi:hypothetical protein|nr:DUF4405 domain-containing protein [Bacteroidales bacterium]HOS71898.1 DUF4405 domain-containing protein [Bacteroidales bacterium]HQH23212.1 DUF4405 domain-containing protein [Bacteroidales bacterium]HQJ80930.1 DUF4405 domain-containing protein [Bacteroidales bacterium]